GTGKVAFGNVEQRLRNSAFTSIREPDGRVTSDTDNALFVSPGNAGRFSRTRFAVVPEGSFKVGFDFNEHVRLTFGYTFLYLSHALRPADQLDRNVNVQPVGAPFVIPSAAPPP